MYSVLFCKIAKMYYVTNLISFISIIIKLQIYCDFIVIIVRCDLYLRYVETNCEIFFN